MANRIYPAIGSRWKENDPRPGVRWRTVIAHDFKRARVQLDGPVKTWAKVERFNGKRGGYSPKTNAAPQASPSVAPADSEFGSAVGPAVAAPTETTKR